MRVPGESVSVAALLADPSTLVYGIGNSGGGSTEANRNVVRDNLVHDNVFSGIQAQGNVLVTGNTAHGQRGESGDECGE